MTSKSTLIKMSLAAGMLALALSGCGSGGGDRADGVVEGPPPPNGPIEPPPPILPPSDVDSLTDSDVVTASIIGVTMDSPPTVTISLIVNGGQALTGLQTTDIRASLAKLSTGGEFATLDWHSSISGEEDPVCRDDIDVEKYECSTFSAPGTDPAAIPDSSRAVQDVLATGKTVRAQAITESGGGLVDNKDGSWSYTLLTDPGNPAALETIHRVCLQFSLAVETNNPCIDFVPQDLVNPSLADQATSLDPGFYANYDSRQIVTDATCNSCHSKLAIHGGGRTALDYCVTCHNPGTTDANSEHTVDLKVMVHRIHNGKNLPSVIDGTAYKIWGFNNSEHDFSAVSYPQNVRQCARCHAGQEDFFYAAANGLPTPRATLTADGHNWASYEGREACESCHDDKTNHGGGGATACTACHNAASSKGDVQQRHRDPLEESANRLSLHVISAGNLGGGEFPVVTFTLNRDGRAINIKNNLIFRGKLMMGVAWDAATDNDNKVLSGFDSLNIELDAIGDSIALGANVFRITSPNPVTADQDTVQIMLFGHETDGPILTPTNTAIVSEVQYFPSTASVATPRREVADINKCDDCHHRLAMTDFGHANLHASPGDNLKVCASCHGPGLGFKEGTPTDFRVLVHGIHAGGFRENYYKDPKYGPDNIQFPGDLSNCETCHLPGTHTILPTSSPPLKGGASYTTAVAATCRSCHDGDVAAAHMVQAGGAVIDGLQSVADSAQESCDICHSSGSTADVDSVHKR